jgi:hypothetical protein
MTRALAAAAAAAWLAVAASPALGAAPDFTGAWELDLSRSTFGTTVGTAPVARRDTLIQRGPELEVRSHIEKKDEVQRLAYRYRTDGRETVNKVSGIDVKSIATWKGRELEVRTRAQMLFIALKVDERWRLEEGGRVLRIERMSQSPLGRQPQTLVFVRR